MSYLFKFTRNHKKNKIGTLQTFFVTAIRSVCTIANELKLNVLNDSKEGAFLYIL